MIYAQDDIIISTKSTSIQTSTTENVDYLEYIPTISTNDHYLLDNLNLMTRLKLYKQINNNDDDLINKRINNICWRRCYKNLYNLKDFKPYLINWDKNSDITWLFGPKVVIPQEITYQQVQEEEIQSQVFDFEQVDDDDEDEVCSLLSDDDDDDESEVSSISTNLSFERKNSISSSNSSYFDVDQDQNDQSYFEYSLKSSLKQSSINIKKNVSFNYIVNTREIINGISFDYDFLDHECL